MIKVVNQKMVLVRDTDGNMNQRGIYMPSSQNDNLYRVFETESEAYKKDMTVAIDKNRLVKIVISGKDYFIADEKDILAIVE
jgi:co-chaperonin GroES (HSP10)